MKGLNRKGLTLVELLIYIALVSIITTILVMIFMVGFKDFISGSRFVDQQTRLNNAYLSFREQFEKAREVIIKNGSIELKYEPVDTANTANNPAVFIEEAKSGDKMTDVLSERMFHKEWKVDNNPTNEWKLFQKDMTTNSQFEPVLERLDDAKIEYSNVTKTLTITLQLKPDNVTQQNQQNLATSRNITRPVIWSFDTIHKKVTVPNNP